MQKRMDPLFIKNMEKFKKIEKKYLEKYGLDSLEHVHLWNPLHIEQYPKEVEIATQQLERSIETNQPLDNTKPEVKVVY